MHESKRHLIFRHSYQFCYPHNCSRPSNNSLDFENGYRAYDRTEFIQFSKAAMIKFHFFVDCAHLELLTSYDNHKISVIVNRVRPYPSMNEIQCVFSIRFGSRNWARQRPIRAALISSFCSAKRLEVFLFPLDGML